MKLSRLFWPEVRPQRRLLVMGLVALFAEVGLRLLEPWPLKLVFDYVLGGAKLPVTETLWLRWLVESSGGLLLTAAALVVLLTGARSVAAYANTVWFALLGNRAVAVLRARLFEHLQLLSLTFHHRSRAGDLTVRVVGDMGMLQDVAVTSLLPAVGRTLVLAGMVAVMFWMNWQLALLALAPWPLFWLYGRRQTRAIGEVARQQRRREGALASMVAESMSSMRVVQSLGLEARFNGAFSKQNDRNLTEGVKGRRLSARLERSVDLVIAVATALVLVQGARLVLKQALTPGDLLVFLAYLKTAFRPARDFAKFSGRVAKAGAAAERVFQIFHLTPAIQDRADAVPAPPFAGHVRFERVSFAYEAGVPVLTEINLELAPGQCLALVGESGAGKSTLSSLLLRLYDPTTGRVCIDGRDLRDYRVGTARSQMALVLQENTLFATNLRENIIAGRPDVTEDELIAAATLANAHDFISALPEGYDTIVGERGATLSHGQRQRVAIARAALRPTPLLLLDEPTAGLDEPNDRLVMAALRKLARGRTTLLITHRREQAEQADQVAVIAGGRIVEQGRPAELRQAGGAYANMFERTAPDGKEQAHAFAR